MQGLTAVEALDQTKAALDAATQAFEPYRFQAQDNAQRRALLEDLNLTQSNYDAAVKRLNYEYVLEVANANLNKARQEYEKYKDGPAADGLALSEAQLASAQAKLAQAEKEKAIEDLVAPMDGTVISLDATVGEPVSSGAIFTIADLTQVKLEVYLDETDLDKVAIGNAVEATFDALPDQVFSGKVISVDPSLQSVSNSQAIKIDVLLEVGKQVGTLPVGLNATVDVIAGKAENAVLAPIEALRELDDGEYAVFVVENGEPTLRSVQVGLQDVTFAEIISGLEAGEVVSTGTQATK
jgi:RND family efflux transporter MFP subunit